MFFFHIWADLDGVLEDILGVDLIYPCAVDTAVGMAIGPIAAFYFGHFFKPGVEVESIDHGADCTRFVFGVK